MVVCAFHGGLPLSLFLCCQGIESLAVKQAPTLHILCCAVSNQVKSTDNLAPTDNEDIRFSLKKPVEETKIVTCHLGNGSSIAAVQGGKCVDTTMGLTPLDGLMMGTRSGSIDPSIIKYMIDEAGMKYDEVDDALNKKSGLKNLIK